MSRCDVTLVSNIIYTCACVGSEEELRMAVGANLTSAGKGNVGMAGPQDGEGGLCRRRGE